MIKVLAFALLVIFAQAIHFQYLPSTPGYTTYTNSSTNSKGARVYYSNPDGTGVRCSEYPAPSSPSDTKGIYVNGGVY